MFTLEDELPVESLKNIDDAITDMAPALKCQEVNLSKCPASVPGQEFALVSFVGPDCSQKSVKAGFRVLGCFKTVEAANEHARTVMAAENHFDLYVCNMYQWSLCTPPRGSIDVEKCDKELNDLVSKHKETQERGKLASEERKRLLIEQDALRQAKLKEENKRELL